MRVLIAGIDGYLGWTLAQHLAAKGHTIGGIDAQLRRQWVTEVGGQSAIPIAPLQERLQAFQERFGDVITFLQGDLLNQIALEQFLRGFQADTIVHLAEMPSAAYSMMDSQHAAFTQQNNVIGSLNLLWAIRSACPSAHLIKLGTMGEYGTPNLDIPEGFFEVEFRGRKDKLPFPRQAGSFYHWSKVHDSHNVMFACRIWGLRATDIMQGVVYGTHVDEADWRLATRLDFDECFGTIINRFCCQALIGHPLTIYGSGQQVRGFLPLKDSMQCLTLVIENPPQAGEYRVFNQFETCYSLNHLAQTVQQVGGEHGLTVEIHHCDNPRIESETHYYNPDRAHLVNLGYSPSFDLVTDIRTMFRDLRPHRQRIFDKQHVLLPDIHWN